MIDLDRIEICRRHGLDPNLAPELRGTTRSELEADAAARAAIARIAAERSADDEERIGGRK